MVKPDLVLIGAEEITDAATRALATDVTLIRFATLEQFDRWRAGAFEQPLTIQREVVKALRQIDCQKYMLSGALRRIFEWLALRSVAPGVSDLEAQFPSRRTFYRVWSESIPEPPAAFLLRVRLLHARRLIDRSAMSQKEAALGAGFSSVHQLRRALVLHARIVTDIPS
jgi:transcriptional regulator GlxA family with amidase domain